MKEIADTNFSNKFNQIIENIQNKSDFNVLLDTTINNLVDFTNAEGGILSLYYDPLITDNWKYLVYNNFARNSNYFSKITKIITKTYEENRIQILNFCEFLPNNIHIVSFPLNIQNNCKGVACLFIKNYLSDQIFRIVSALCNQIMFHIEKKIKHDIQKKHEILKKQELDAQRYNESIIGACEKIQKINNIIERIKDTPTTILIEGPIGTEKELIAKTVHINSNRRNKKFVSQFCGHIQTSILENELFGNEVKSFSGTKQNKISLIEIADGGTLYLDEIANIDFTLQVKLLRFIHDSCITKINKKMEKVDIRIICSTSKTLKKEVQNNNFLPELFYCLNVAKIKIPSLNERKSDIPLLSIHFLEKYRKKIGKEVIGITDEAIKYLENYNWPGNVKQLEKEIERSVTFVENNSFISPLDLSEDILHFHEFSASDIHINNTTVNNSEFNQLLEEVTLKTAVEKLEKQMIIQILDETGWNQTQTAKKLGLSRQGLIKKIQRYELEK